MTPSLRAVLAVGAAAAAGALLASPSAGRGLASATMLAIRAGAELGGPSDSSRGSGTAAARGRWPLSSGTRAPGWPGPRPALLVAAGVAVAVALVLDVPPVVGVLVGAAGVLIGRRARRLRQTRAAAARRAATLELCLALTGELRAGRAPATALHSAATAVPALRELLRPALAAAGTGAGVPAALIRAADAPGAAALRRVAACWTVAAATGAGLASALDRLADMLRDEETVRRELAAQLAGPRASAKLLAALPAVALLLGAGIGARPLTVLLETPLGLGCLVVGAALVAAGVVWTERLVAAVEARL